MKKHLLAIAVTALATGTVFAQANDTLAKIKSTGSVTLGVRESSGLGYTLGNGKYVGFHTEMGERILKDIQKQLGLTALEVKYQPVTSQNRIPLVQNGTVDIECGSTTNNTARQKDAAFAFTTYVEEVRIATRANSGITGIKDLNGKTTANTISSTYATLAESYGAKTTGVDDLNQTIELLLNGRVDATLNAEVTYFDYLKEHPDANIKIAALTNDASQVAFPVRKGDETATLREALNQAINELREDGTIAEISEKYFGTDLSQAPSAN